jgi:hypothetical protein
MRSMTRVWIAASCMAAVSWQAAARAGNDPQGEVNRADTAVTMTKTSVIGDTVQYKQTIESSASGTDVKVETSRKQRVKEVRDNGEIVITLTDEGGKYTQNGAASDIPAGSPVTVTVDKFNKVLSYKPQAEGSGYFSPSTRHLLFAVDTIVFPDKAVKPGDTWKTEIDNPAVKGKKVTIRTTFVGAEAAAGVSSWKLKQTLEAAIDMNGGTITAETTALLDSANWQVIQLDQTVKGVPSENGALDWKATLRRVKPEAEKTSK